jgi:RHS repeat-associated protein
VVDKQYNFLDAAFDQINDGATSTHDLLEQEVTITEEGYVYVYLSNENASQVNVYFDDVVMTYTPSPVIQYNEYYPFGLQASTSWTRDNNSNQYLYNSANELNTNTGWYEMFFRGYDPSVGRMLQVDPLATKYTTLTPYNYAFNDPVYWNDPSGADPFVERVLNQLNYFSEFDEMEYMHVADFFSDFYGSGPGLRNHVHIDTKSGFVLVVLNSDPYDKVWVDGIYRGQTPKDSWKEYAPDAVVFDSYQELYKYLQNIAASNDEQQTQGGPQTWYYMSRNGAPHGMVYDPVGKVIYEVNGVPGQDSWYEQLERLIINSAPSNNVKAKISVAYQYRQSNDAEWSSLWEHEAGNTFLLSPVTVSNPAAATAWFQGQTGNAWNYSLGANNCAHYSVQGLNAGGAGINFLGPLPSSFPVAPTLTWTAGQPYPVSIGK